MNNGLSSRKEQNMNIYCWLMYAELSITSNFTFLTGASHPEEYIRRAALAGLSAIAIADDNTVAGIVRAHAAAREIARLVKQRQAFDATKGLIGPPRPSHLPIPASAAIYGTPRLIPAARLRFVDGPDLTVLAQTRQGWATLCRLLSTGRQRATKGTCQLWLDDLIGFGANGLQLLLHPPPALAALGGAKRWLRAAKRLTSRFGTRMHLVMAPCYDGQDPARFAAFDRLAHRLGLPVLASAAPLMHHGRRRKLADVVTAVRLGSRVDALGQAALRKCSGCLRSPHSAAACL